MVVIVFARVLFSQGIVADAKAGEQSKSMLWLYDFYGLHGFIFWLLLLRL